MGLQDKKGRGGRLKVILSKERGKDMLRLLTFSPANFCVDQDNRFDLFVLDLCSSRVSAEFPHSIR